LKALLKLIILASTPALAAPLSAPFALPWSSSAPMQTAPVAPPATVFTIPRTAAPGGLNAVCDEPPRPRKVRLQSGANIQVLFLNDGKLGVTAGQLQSPEKALPPGNTITLTGECLGSAGQVEMEWVSAQAHSGSAPFTVRIQVRTTRLTASIQTWDTQRNAIHAVVPDFSGVPPGGHLRIQVRGVDALIQETAP
jgi:hypothetical protein